jgi:hypothetical protein
MRHVTRLQLSLSARAPVLEVAAFIRSELPPRAAYISTLLGANSAFWGTSVPAASELQQDLARIQASNTGHLLHSCGHIQNHLNDFLRQHRYMIQEQRATGRNLLQGEQLLDRIQYNLSSLQPLLSRLHGVNSASDPDTLQTSTSEDSQYQRGLTVTALHMDTLLQKVVEELRPFAVEKFGVAPPMEQHYAVRSSHKCTVLGLPSFATFVLTELCKNSMAAMINKYTALGVDDAPAIQIVLASTPSHVSIRFSDTAGGIRDAVGCKSKYNYFESTAVHREEMNYQYSREFGAPFSGWGIGLARSSLYARYFDGNVSLLSTPGYGTIAQATFERTGSTGSDVW